MKMLMKMFVRFAACTAIAVAMLINLTGCEETLSGADVDLPYREELIVQGFLTAEGKTDTIVITRTLPPLEKWSVDKAAVTDAVATVTSEGVEYPLVHVRRGKYIVEGLRPAVGKSYLLNVTWKNLKVTGTASIPRRPELIGLTLDTVEGGCDWYFSENEQYFADEIRVLAEYVPHGSNMNSARLGISYSLDGQTQYVEDSYEYFFYDIDSSGATNVAVINQRCYTRDNPYEMQLDTLFLQFVEYEASFRSFYETRWRDNDGDLFFGPSGEQPAWNISGDGFGWFFGRSTLRDTTVVK